jgi:ParB family transcriptional regulator, chromosome partitioning protein
MVDEAAKRKGLGRGLAALLGEDGAEDYTALDRLRAAKDVPIEQLQPNRFQPRRRFDDETMDELTQSVRERGVLQPILVRRTGAPNIYEIVAGERRWRAAQKAQLHQVPVTIKDLSDADALEIALIENIQRQDLNALEEAGGYRRLMQEFNHTQEKLATAVGKSRSHVANMLRLLTLPDSVKAMIADGRLTFGHARALLAAADPVALAKQIVEGGMNVRQTEDAAATGKTRRHKKTAGKDPNTVALENDLSIAVGMRVTLHHRGDKGGEIRVAYSNLEQLDELCRRLTRHADIGGKISGAGTMQFPTVIGGAKAPGAIPGETSAAETAPAPRPSLN